MPNPSKPTILVNGIRIESKSKTNNDKIDKLKSSVEEKRQLLNQIYTEITKDTACTTQPLNALDTNLTSALKIKPGTSILKHVQFESSDEEEPRYKTINRVQTSRPTTDNHGKKAKENDSKTKATSSDRTQSAFLKPKESKYQQHKANTKVTNRSNRPVVLTVQQKRELELAKKAEFVKAVELLHVKVITRKYAYIWLRRFFYSNTHKSDESRALLLLPSQIEKYHSKRVVSVMLNKWHKETCWVRNEWRLTVKAQCHHNYVILSKLWECWKAHTIERKADNVQVSKAVGYSDFKLRSLYFREWKSQTTRTIKNRINLIEVQKLRNLEVLKNHFAAWSTKYKEHRRLAKLSRKADQHFKLIQLNKCYLIWQYKFTTGKDERNAERLAIKHHNTVVQEKCLQSLRYYAAYRRKKKIQKQKLTEYAESQLVYRVYHTWFERFQMKRQDQEIAFQINEFKNRFIVARFLEHWKNAYNSRVYLEMREAKMIKFYQKKIKSKAFNLLKQNYLNAQNEKKNEQLAERFDRFWIKKRYYSIWADKFEEKTDMRSIHLMFKARLHFEKKLVRNAFSIWHEFNRQCLIDKSKANKADNLHYKHLRKFYFNMIRIYVTMNKTKRNNYKTAVAVCNENTYSKYYSRWMAAYELTIELQLNTRIAILHEEDKCREKTFALWYQRFKDKLTEECQMALAAAHHKKICAKKVFTAWRAVIDESKEDFLKEHLARLSDYKRVCLPIFEIWKKYTQHSKDYTRKLNMADKFYKTKILQKNLSIWQHRTKQFKHINLQVECKFQLKQREKIHAVLHQLQQHVVDRKHEMFNENLATTFYLKQLMHRIVTNWVSYTRNKALKRYEEANQIETFRTLRNKLIIKSVYLKWRKCAKSAIDCSIKFQMAVRFWECKRKEALLVAWRSFAKESVRRKMMDRQAGYFLEMRLKMEFYFQWCNAFKREVGLRDKNQDALMFWSVNIQRKCLLGWIRWHRIKKEKKKRYKAALDKRQLDILRICGRNFIEYSTDSRIRRMHAIRLLKETNYIENTDLQAKYFNIWLNKCNFIKNKKPLNSSDSTNQTLIISSKTDFVIESNTLEHKEITTGILTDLGSRSRPAPRKPSFLIDSVDMTNKDLKPVLEEELPKRLEINVAKSDNLSPKSTEIQIELERSVQPVARQLQMVLLPPSAFTSVKTVECIMQSTQSVSHISNREFSSDLGQIVQTVTKPNDQGLASASSASVAKRKSDRDLIDFKKRLENLTIKTDKLKRLKEQERLLNKCIESNETNKALSFCGTIHEEKDQVTIEINELVKEIRNEKQQIGELAKKYKL